MPIVKGPGDQGKAAIYDWEREVCAAVLPARAAAAPVVYSVSMRSLTHTNDTHQ